MRLKNFNLTSPYGCAVIRGCGHDWDLHNFADFQGFFFTPDRDDLVMEWLVVPGEENPWGSRGNAAAGCRLCFSGIRYLRVVGRDTDYPAEESSCLASISKVEPGESEYRGKEKWEPGEPFRLLFQFQDGRQIEVEADSVSLEALK